MSLTLASLSADQFVALLQHRNAPPPCVAALRHGGYTGHCFFGDPSITPKQVVGEAFDDDTMRQNGVRPLHLKTLTRILNELLAAERSGPPVQRRSAAVAALGAPETSRGGGAAAAAAAVAGELPVAPATPSGKKKKRPQQQQPQPQDQLAPPPPRPRAVNDGDDDEDDQQKESSADASIYDLSLPKKTAITINNQETQGRTVFTKAEQSEFDKLRNEHAVGAKSLLEQLQKARQALLQPRKKIEQDEGNERREFVKSEETARSSLKSRKSKDKAEVEEDEMLSKAAVKAAANSRVCVECQERLPERSFSKKEWAAAAGGGRGAGAAAAVASASPAAGGTCTACVAKRSRAAVAAAAGAAKLLAELVSAAKAGNEPLVDQLLDRAAADDVGPFGQLFLSDDLDVCSNDAARLDVLTSAKIPRLLQSIVDAGVLPRISNVMRRSVPLDVAPGSALLRPSLVEDVIRFIGSVSENCTAAISQLLVEQVVPTVATTVLHLSRAPSRQRNSTIAQNAGFFFGNVAVEQGCALREGEVVPALLNFIDFDSSTAPPASTGLLQSVLWALDCICLVKTPPPSASLTHAILPTALHYSLHESFDVRQNSMYLLSRLAEGAAATHAAAVIVGSGLLPATAQFLQQYRGTKDILGFLRVFGSMALQGDTNRHLVDAGVVEMLSAILERGAAAIGDNVDNEAVWIVRSMLANHSSGVSGACLAADRLMHHVIGHMRSPSVDICNHACWAVINAIQSPEMKSDIDKIDAFVDSFGVLSKALDASSSLGIKEADSALRLLLHLVTDCDSMRSDGAEARFRSALREAGAIDALRQLVETPLQPGAEEKEVANRGRVIEILRVLHK